MNLQQVTEWLWRLKTPVVNAYAVKQGDGIALIDTGTAGQADTILMHLGHALGLPADEVRSRTSSSPTATQTTPAQLRLLLSEPELVFSDLPLKPTSSREEPRPARRAYSIGRGRCLLRSCRGCRLRFQLSWTYDSGRVMSCAGNPGQSSSAHSATLRGSWRFGFHLSVSWSPPMRSLLTKVRR